MAHHYIPVLYAGTVTCAPNPREVLSYLPKVRPNWFFAVPRIWEKLKAGLEAMQAAQPEEQRRPIQEAVAAGVDGCGCASRADRSPPRWRPKWTLRRPFNTALIVLDADFAPHWAAQQGLEAGSLAALATQPMVIAAVKHGVDHANQQLARAEQIKKFTIVRGDWLPGGDELTPTIKLKRKPIARKYDREIEAMYSG